MQNKKMRMDSEVDENEKKLKFTKDNCDEDVRISVLGRIVLKRRTRLCCSKCSENIGVDRILDDPRLILEDFRRSYSTYG
ncbi:hypothetical protein PIB30_078771 [Stylosanthes scabra]|uniref:Uncharacterized protein n=1 Tax=Stylosanthes scabra TaxID=79078 RepID=A0ABU6YRJ5_9FABA|nr:hypothetical protein [Stylosanthes scabra]